MTANTGPENMKSLTSQPTKAGYPGYLKDDGKYEKNYIPAYKTGYPVTYHY